METVTPDSRFDNMAFDDSGYDWDWLSEPECEPLDLAGWLQEQASWYRSTGTDAGAWLARQLDELAATARHLHARNVTDYDDRIEALEHDRERHLIDAETWAANARAHFYH